MVGRPELVPDVDVGGAGHPAEMAVAFDQDNAGSVARGGGGSHDARRTAAEDGDISLGDEPGFPRAGSKTCCALRGRCGRKLGKGSGVGSVLGVVKGMRFSNVPEIDKTIGVYAVRTLINNSVNRRSYGLNARSWLGVRFQKRE